MEFSCSYLFVCVLFNAVRGEADLRRGRGDMCMSMLFPFNLCRKGLGSKSPLPAQNGVQDIANHLILDSWTGIATKPTVLTWPCSTWSTIPDTLAAMADTRTTKRETIFWGATLTTGAQQQKCRKSSSCLLKLAELGVIWVYTVLGRQTISLNKIWGIYDMCSQHTSNILTRKNNKKLKIYFIFGFWALSHCTLL